MADWSSRSHFDFFLFLQVKGENFRTIRCLSMLFTFIGHVTCTQLYPTSVLSTQLPTHHLIHSHKLISTWKLSHKIMLKDTASRALKVRELQHCEICPTSKYLQFLQIFIAIYKLNDIVINCASTAFACGRIDKKLSASLLILNFPPF